METPVQCCSSCSSVLPLTSEFFHKDKSRISGFHIYCKACRKKLAQDLYERESDRLKQAHKAWASANKEHVNAKSRERRKANPEKWKSYLSKSRAKRRKEETEYARIWRAKNREHAVKYDRAYRASIRDRQRQNAQKARERARDRYRAYAANYRALKRTGTGVTEQDIKQQFEKQNGCCFWCSESVIDNKYHVDHVIPLSRDGKHDSSNIVIACPFCNQSKTDKLPYTEWIPPNPLTNFRDQ